MSLRLIFAVLLSFPSYCLAAVAPLSPIPMHHTSWTARDGAPASVFAIAQGTDGWLWLGTVMGLYRFDGVTFERFRPPGPSQLRSDVWAMRMIDGALWLGYRSGGVAVWEHERLRTYGKDDGLPPNTVTDFARDAQGRMWAATSRGLYLFDGRRWSAPAQTGAPEDPCLLLADGGRTVWAQCGSGVYALDAGAERFGKRAGPAGRARLTQAPDGTVWSSNGPQGKAVPLSAPGAGRPAPTEWPTPRANAGAMLFERDDRHVWISVDQGVVRAGPDEAGTPFGMRDGLSGAIVMSLYEDREGNIWAGTENGLDRFRASALQGVALPQVLNDSVAIAAADKGGLWVAGHLVPEPSREALLALPADIDRTPVAALFRDGPGGVLSAGADGIWQIRDGVRTRIEVAPGERADGMFAVVRDGEGNLWAGGRARGVLRLADGKWEQLEPARLKAYALYPEPGGPMWFGLPDNTVRVLRGSRLDTYGAADGIGVGTVMQIVRTSAGILIGGSEGLCRFDGKRCHTVVGDDGDPFLGISGLVERDGAIWANGTGGITVIRSDDLRAVPGAAPQRVPYRRLGYEDGLAGTPSTTFSLPTAVVGTDGKLWFTTSAGLFWLDPQARPKKAPPPVTILRVLADGAAVPRAGGSWRIPPRTWRVRIEYTALNLGMPERTRFLYRLRGAGTQWTENRNVRAMEYTNLAPGRYAFELRAANDDGAWSDAPASVEFVVLPAFYQTTWFRLVGALVVAALLYALYRVRVRTIATRVRERMQERFLERERIARDLHDTFLQTVYGLMLKTDNAVRRLKADEPARRELEDALRLARETIDQGRDKVHALRDLEPRTPDSQETDIVRAVRTVMDIEDPGAASVGTGVTGTVRPLEAGVFEELADIGREALRNAIRHAQAGAIRIDVAYGDAELVLSVRDDGKGIPAAVLAAGGRPGHWGLAGMRERVARVGGTFALQSDAHGTCVRVAFPAALAYAEAPVQPRVS